MSWVFLIVGVVCLIALQALRSGLSFVYPEVRAAIPRRAPRDEEVAGGDLFETAEASLQTLGFEGPMWIETQSEPQDDASVTLHAAYWHANSKTTAWLAPPVDVAAPNQPLTYLTTRLRDDRVAVTQVSDPFFSTVDDPATPAQTVAPAELAGVVDEHRSFVDRHGGPAALGGPPARECVRFATEHMNGIRQRLIERGSLVVSDGVARAGLRFAVRLLINVLCRPKPGAAQRTASPPERVAHLSKVVTASQHRAPARHVQWLLLAVSALLFVVIGWPFLGLQLTIVLLGVIFFHEAGHWLAMRVAGYRNPHITLLPLLGGVTIGHESDPSAAKRAWVSLAGPLPGVILGWVLVLLLYRGGSLPDLSHWLTLVALMLLVVNYLNVLPVPPLDGSHVVRALLPRRWVALHIVIVLLGVGAGVLLAWLLDFWALAFIAGLQLFAIRSIASDARLIRRVRPDWSVDLLDICRHLDAHDDSTKPAAVQVAQALRVKQQLDMRPMNVSQRLLVTTVYAALAVVPIAAVAFATVVTGIGREEMDASILADEQAYESLRAQASALSPDEIVTDLSLTLSPAASDAQIAAAERRLGQPLPPHLRNWYRLSNGVPELDVGPIDAVQRLHPGSSAHKALQAFSYDGELTFFRRDDFATVSLQDTDSWWQIGGGTDYETFTFVDPDAGSGEFGVYQLVVDYAEAYTDMDELLRRAWVDDRWNVLLEERMDERLQQARQQFGTYSMDELMAEFPRPGFVERLVTGTWRLPDGASEAELRALEARIGRTLPGDHRQLLGQHDGYPPLFILSTDSVQSAADLRGDQREYLINAFSAAAGDSVGEDTVAACWVIMGMVVEDYGDFDGGVYPHALWCPDAAVADRRYYNAMSPGFADSLTAVLRETLAYRKGAAMD
ncbi:MAG: M50 family metallopeptidase [Woeseiaceae bacterium]|nr:M50 family metallopeptidase [Woeseiaceae bacterium]